MNNEYNNLQNEQNSPQNEPVTAPQQNEEPTAVHAPAEQAQPVQAAAEPEAENAQSNDLYAQKHENQNAAFAQSQQFHRETPYDNGTESQAQPQPQQTQQASAQSFNPYTGQPYSQTFAKSAQNSGAAAEAKPKKKRGAFIKKAASFVALALIFGVVSGAVFLGVTGGFNRGGYTPGDPVGAGVTDEDSSVPPQLNGSVSGQLQSASTTMQEALEKAQIAMQGNLTIPQINIIMEPAMVSINCIGETTVNSFFGAQTYQTASSGSGIIVGENETELLIVTNNHVIADTTEISVQFVDEQECKALVKGTDAINDLAIIVVNLADIPAETMSAIAYAEIGDSDALVIGEGVVAIGNALGFGQSVTQGIVSALNRAVTDSNGNTTYLIQTDAAINPGNSGGALVNMKGQVIGINSAKYSDEAVEGMCFAIPVNTAMPILEDLMSRTTRVEITDPDKAAYLGITPGQDITSQIAAAYKMPIGLYVSDVQEDGPAGTAGMYAGDIITKFDHDTITGYSDLRSSLSYYEAGETVEITVARLERGKYVDVVLTVTLGVRPAEAETPETEPEQEQPSEGFGYSDDYPSWFDFFGW